MKTNILIVVIIAILLTSCAPKMPAPEIEVTNDVPTELPVTEVTMTQELLVTAEPTATKTPTKVPDCMALLTPRNDAEIPAIGKVTFSWNPVNAASFYVLDLILPSGTTVSFETKQTFRNQYMEAFSAGGTYQWKVTAFTQDRKRNAICSSELATFNKPASTLPQPTGNPNRKKN